MVQYFYLELQFEKMSTIRIMNSYYKISNDNFFKNYVVVMCKHK